MVSLSVIICTYNPDQIVFKRCLDSITTSSKQVEPLEIIIIDNNSSTPLVKQDYINKFLQQTASATLIVEEKQGLTQARLRGIKESKGSLLVFIDDDNIIEESFFAAATRVAEEHPFIGAFSGQVLLEYTQENYCHF